MLQLPDSQRPLSSSQRLHHLSYQLHQHLAQELPPMGESIFSTPMVSSHPTPASQVLLKQRQSSRLIHICRPTRHRYLLCSIHDNCPPPPREADRQGRGRSRKGSTRYLPLSQL